jgi:predicted amino acid racemase
MYPRVEINLKKLRSNIDQMVSRCANQGIDVAGVIKGCTGIPQCAKQFEEGGCKFIASSRLEQLQDAKDFGIKLPLMLIRVPMLSEIKDVISLTDISLNSEEVVLKALNDEAIIQGKVHQVILMADLGDLREGFWNKEELLNAAIKVETQMQGLELAGIGTNLGCYGSINATPEKLQELVDLAELIEKRIGRTLKYISGGATTSLPRVLEGNMPKRVNLLRVGEGILLAKDLKDLWGLDMSFMYQDVFVLKAEVIEVKDKPSHPVGEIMFDAFGFKQEYVDRGIRRRALLAMGKVDYAFPDMIYPRDKGIEILGASSDHTIVDVQDAERDFKVGDIMTFDLCYATIVYVTNTRNVKQIFVED